MRPRVLARPWWRGGDAYGSAVLQGTTAGTELLDGAPRCRWLTGIRARSDCLVCVTCLIVMLS